MPLILYQARSESTPYRSRVSRRPASNLKIPKRRSHRLALYKLSLRKSLLAVVLSLKHMFSPLDNTSGDGLGISMNMSDVWSGPLKCRVGLTAN